MQTDSCSTGSDSIVQLLSKAPNRTGSEVVCFTAGGTQEGHNCSTFAKDNLFHCCRQTTCSIVADRQLAPLLQTDILFHCCSQTRCSIVAGGHLVLLLQTDDLFHCLRQTTCSSIAGRHLVLLWRTGSPCHCCRQLFYCCRQRVPPLPTALIRLEMSFLFHYSRETIVPLHTD